MKHFPNLIIDFGKMSLIIVNESSPNLQLITEVISLIPEVTSLFPPTIFLILFIAFD